ncbi:hypothetical protein EU537_03780 [Candidatus Thorarchaeota archaeon]|nr:MAG: hypothetical protein EU537_03780 [Candidatus Thorarchaeota archaeon]
MGGIVDEVIHAFRVIGRRGLTVEQLTKQLDSDTNEIASTIKQLITEKRIMEKAESKEARYFLRTLMDNEQGQGGIGDLDGCPCFHCLKIGKCGIRQPDSPVACRELDQWMESSDSN